MITCFQNNYRSRLAKMFVVNVSLVIGALWAIAESFMDSVTKSKLRLTMGNNHEEILEVVHPNQLLKAYGGNCDLPANVWPPEFPKGVNRDEYKIDHTTDEELKKDLQANPRMMAPPSLAAYARSISKAANKKGVFPRKSYRFKTRIERRDSFNGIIPEVQSEPAKVEEIVPSIPPIKVKTETVPPKAVEEKKVPDIDDKKVLAVSETAKIEAEDGAEKKKMKEEVKKEEVRKDEVKTEDVKVEVAANLPDPNKKEQPHIEKQEEEIMEKSAKPVVNEKAVPAASESAASPGKKNESEKSAELPAKAIEILPASSAPVKAVPPNENGEATINSTTNGSINPKIQPHFNQPASAAANGKPKSEADPAKEGDNKKACCACITF